MPAEPKHRPVPAYIARHARNPYEGRWMWWYSSIADWLLRNPGGSIEDLAKHVHKHPQTVRSIMSSDVFKDYFAERKAEWRQRHDDAILGKTTAVAEKALDIVLDKMEKQADKIPMAQITEIATSALDRLGYAPKSTPSVEVNVNTDNRKVVMIPISAAALEEARDAIRTVEEQRKMAARVALELEAEPEVPESGEVKGADLDPDYRS